jgi:hypothetical protein
VDGGNLVIESRLAEGRTEKLSALASELVALKLDAIVGADGGAARALSRATKTIPIAMGVLLPLFRSAPRLATTLFHLLPGVVLGAAALLIARVWPAGRGRIQAH